LQKVDKQRAQNRNHRQKSATPSVSLIGYTNAGKSTLFNQLTGAHTYVANQLFATLDPTLRQCLLTEGSQIVLADTVGFISHLPHEIVAASAEDREDKINQVNQVIQEIGADSVAQLQIMNKIDKLETMSPRIDRDDQGKAIRVWLSAATGLGLNELLSVLGEYCATDKIQVNCRLSSEHKQLYAQLAYLGEIVSETFNPDGSRELTVQLAKKHLGLLKTANVLI
jgi:GTP-binding protein HflX